MWLVSILVYTYISKKLPSLSRQSTKAVLGPFISRWHPPILRGFIARSCMWGGGGQHCRRSSVALCANFPDAFGRCFTVTMTTPSVDRSGAGECAAGRGRWRSRRKFGATEEGPRTVRDKYSTGPTWIGPTWKSPLWVNCSCQGPFVFSVRRKARRNRIRFSRITDVTHARALVRYGWTGCAVTEIRSKSNITSLRIGRFGRRTLSRQFSTNHYRTIRNRCKTWVLCGILFVGKKPIYQGIHVE